MKSAEVKNEPVTGDENEPERFIQVYYQILFRFCCRLLGDGEEARDVTQETFMSYQLQCRQGVNIENHKAWLYRTAGNHCTDVLRRRNRFRCIFFRNEFLPGTAESTDRQAEKEQMGLLLRASFSRLTVRERLLLSMYRDDLSYAEMASIADIRPSSVGKLLSRAIASLAREVERGGA